MGIRLLGIATFLPIAYCAFFVGFVFFTLVTSWQPTPAILTSLIVVHCICVFLVMGLFVYYARHAYKNEHFTREQRLIWIALMFIANPVVIPYYWYNYIFHKIE